MMKRSHMPNELRSVGGVLGRWPRPPALRQLHVLRKGFITCLSSDPATAGIALAADPADVAEAARVRGAVAALRQNVESGVPPEDEELEGRFERPLIDALGEEAYATEQAIGAEMSLEDAIALARSLADRSRIGVVDS
jgi:hypothetical protein